jgi:hypothetical protein
MMRREQREPSLLSTENLKLNRISSMLADGKGALPTIRNQGTGGAK